MTPWQEYKAKCAELGAPITFDYRWSRTKRFTYIVDRGQCTGEFVASRRSSHPFPQGGTCLGFFATYQEAITACEQDYRRFSKSNLEWKVRS